MIKSCGKCKEEKLYSEFNKSKKMEDGYQFYCRSCQSALYKAYAAVKKHEPASVEAQPKVCTHCGLKKPPSQFGKRSMSRDKLNYYCKPCWRIIVYENKRRSASGTKRKA